MTRIRAVALESVVVRAPAAERKHEKCQRNDIYAMWVLEISCGGESIIYLCDP
jgi:hypothetical protein